MIRPLALISLLGTLNLMAVQPPTDAKILTAIGLVETGMKRTARGDAGHSFGAYQMSQDSWATGNRRLSAEGLPTYPFRQWRSEIAQDAVAMGLILAIRDRLKTEGVVTPTPEQIALVWNMGWSGAKRVGFRVDAAPPVRADYANRVGNLVRDAK